ncbi:hypothetical protein RclHR1_04320004 [Rhizophagus clarus]|uniref:Kinase-like domain-containing protein n=1 Tax=Rhizophagus clarus TaxID=94130 RepID=A0A2Z6RL66_9GLOM|nr:hypothetical protein RclHR1_04320004 [Rhizophagus clarus]GES97467.1 kinase-like domain-containing protein [Rhizophagus clarus]
MDAKVIGPYIPLIQKATSLINNIIEICEMASYNKKICNTLIERVVVTYASLKLFRLRIQKNEKELLNKDYYNAFYRLVYVLKEIRKYAEDVSRVHGFRKYVEAKLIREKFAKLAVEYDNVMIDLNFVMAVANEERRRYDEEALAENLFEFDRYLKTVDKKVDSIFDQIMYIKNHLGDKAFHGVNRIDSKDLLFPAQEKSDDRRGKHFNFVVRRILNEQEVACKSTSVIAEEGYLKILMKLSKCDHILKFYGVSKINGVNAWVFEWAHRGTLKELYDTKDIQWHYKIQIALKICHGLMFLQKAEILHRDLRCENILITESLEPKIYNFKLVDACITALNNEKKLDDFVRWTAPEKLNNFESNYTTQCEIYSFGILLWELAFEKIPYRSLDVFRIIDHVIGGGREVTKFGDSTPEISRLQEDYKRIIIDTWKGNPQERISFLKALDMLEELYSSINHMFDENLPALLPKNTLDLDGSIVIDETDDDFVLSYNFIVPTIPLVDEGIRAHKEGYHQKAWKCFEYHARNGNTIAKCWKGRYLWEGIHDGIKGREEGRELLKAAADEGNTSAQLYYAFTLKNVLGEGNNIDTFIKYITKAAEGNNDIAQYNLGDIYYKGKLNIQKDENEGIKWLKTAALHDNTRAIKLLETLDISWI